MYSAESLRIQKPPTLVSHAWRRLTAGKKSLTHLQLIHRKQADLPRLLCSTLFHWVAQRAPEYSAEILESPSTAFLPHCSSSQGYHQPRSGMHEHAHTDGSGGQSNQPSASAELAALSPFFGHPTWRQNVATHLCPRLAL